MTLEINFLEILRSSYTLVILIVCSIIMITFAIERWWYFKKIRMDIEKFIEQIKHHFESKKYEDIQALCQKHPGPIAAVVKTALENHHRKKNEVEELVNAARLEERLKLESYLGILGTLGNTAPFIGLFGTVLGIIKAFHDLALSGSGGPSVVAAGIAEALVATAGGLAVAIPSVIIYNYFLKRVKDYSVAMESTQLKILVYLYGDK